MGSYGFIMITYSYEAFAPLVQRLGYEPSKLETRVRLPDGALIAEIHFASTTTRWALQWLCVAYVEHFDDFGNFDVKKQLKVVNKGFLIIIYVFEISQGKFNYSVVLNSLPYFRRRTRLRPQSTRITAARAHCFARTDLVRLIFR